MILQKLILRGFKGLRAGIGLAEVCIDFSQLPGGLIAIVGSNGSGKTTILDNCHPYRLMPYKCRKAKDWTPGAFSFYDQCFGSDAMKELVFEMAGTTYKSLVLIDVQRRKQEAYLYRDDGAAGWFPLNDGKTKTYDEAVERVVGSPSLFFTSVFRSQGAKNLSDYSRGDIMGIISELLNVDHIKAQSDKARKVSDALKAVVATEQSKLDLLREDLLRVGELTDRIDRINLEVNSKRGDLKASVTQLQIVDAEIVDVQKRQAVQDSEMARLEDYKKARALDVLSLAELQRAADLSVQVGRLAQEVVSKREELKQMGGRLLDLDAEVLDVHTRKAVQASELARLEDYKKTRGLDEKALADLAVEQSAELNRLTAEVTTDISRLSSEIESLEADVAACGHRLQERRDTSAKNREALLVKITRAEKIASGAGEIRTKVAAEKEAKASLVEARETLQTLENSRRDLDAIISGLNLQASKSQHALESAEKDAAKLVGLDCHADGSGWLNPSCRFISDAVASRKAIPVHRADFDAIQVALEEKRKALGESDVNIFSAGDVISDLERQIEDLSRWTKLLPELELAEANLSQWRVDLVDLDAALAADVSRISEEQVACERKLKQVRSDLDELRVWSEARQREVKSRFDTSANAIKDRLATLNASIAAFPVFEDLDEVLVVLESRAADLRSEMVGVNDVIRSLEVEVGSINGHLQALASQDAETIRGRIAEHDARIAAFPSFEDLDKVLVGLVGKATALRTSVAGADDVIRSLEVEVGSLNGQLQALEGRRAEAQLIDGKIKAYNAEIANWMLLARACSNDGIIALELDDAAPSIASLVNELLLACYGPRFAVRLDTQSAKANGDMKEAFDIIIYDSETDEEKSITECSGGQTNWLEDAITRGICLFNIHRSDREFGTLFADERDGMLDPEKKLEFLAIKRQALEIGTHEREFFITQTPELWEQAAGRIVLAKGGVTIQ